MPLLRRQPFVKEPVPEDLDPDEYLFHCKLTDEVFRDYDAFFERIILCNSLLWTCEMTGRPALTYLEAIQSEERARAALAAMPRPLKRAMLFLACCARRHRLKDLRDDVIGYMRERFFAGETVDAVVNGERKLCEVVKVIAPHALTNGNSHSRSDDSDSDSVELEFDPSEFHYQVRIVGSTPGTTHVVTAADLMRKKSVFTRDKCKLFLKHACTLTDGTYLAKERFVEKYGLVKMKFSDIFAGAIPQFNDKKRRSAHGKSKKSMAGSSNSSSKKAVSNGTSSKKRKKKKKSSSKDRDGKKNDKKKENEEEEDEDEEEKKENARQKKHEEERRLKKEEKDKEREKQREERRLMAECLKEWQKPRDDLECDDLVDLPNPMAVATALPNEHFGDVLSLLEFFHDFSEFISLKDRFPHGITLDVVESALVESDVRGPLNDLLQLLLTSVFDILDSGGEFVDNSGAVDRVHKEDDAATATSSSKEDPEVRAAAAAANWPMQTLGVSLRNVSLDAFTLTEVLRLHLLSSGIRSGSSGSYLNRDDPSRQFRADESVLLNTLKSKLVFDLTPADKLKILMCLVGQLLTCDTFRENVESKIERLRLARYEFRMFQWAEQRREREELAHRLKVEMEEAAASSANTSADVGSSAAPISKKSIDDVTNKELDKQEAKRRLESSKREREFLELISNLQSRGVVQPLGHDRAHRRFWMFNATPGLFVEDDEDTVGPCLPRPTPYNPNANPMISFNQSVSDARLRQSDKENAAALLLLELAPANAANLVKAQKLLGDNRTNGLNGLAAAVDDDGVVALRKPSRMPSQDSSNGDKKPGVQVFGMCTASGDRCPVHGSARRKRPKWAFFPSTAHVESLISALNPRGFREGNLKEMLVAEKKRVLQSVSKCPVARLNQEAAAMATTNTDERSEEPSKTTESASRKSSRRSLLAAPIGPFAGAAVTGDDQESVISRVVDDKSKRCEDFVNLMLRDSLLKLEEKIYAGGLGSIKVDDREEWRERIGSYDPDSIDDEERDSLLAAKEMASILLQIFNGIETKYIIPPLGSTESGTDAERAGSSLGSRSLASRWKESLSSCTSLSQVFIHIATLEQSIAWSRSVLNARCRICRRKGDAEHMLLCDECDRGHHIYCLKPPLKEIPEGDWVCEGCCPKPKVNARKRRIQVIDKPETDDEAVEVDVDGNIDNVVADNDRLIASTPPAKNRGGRPSKRQKQPVCNACHKNGPLISCVDCHVAYHALCTLPPLKKVPRGKWTCTECAERSIALAAAAVADPKNDSVEPTRRVQSKKRSLSVPTKPTREEIKAIVSSPESPRRSERRVKRVMDYSKHSRESSDDEEEDEEEQTDEEEEQQTKKKKKKQLNKLTKKQPKRRSHLSSDEIPDDEWYGLVRRSMPAVNRRGASDDVPLDFRVCDRLLTELVRHEHGWPFLRPVTRKEVPEYYELVKRPADFGMIRSRLNGMRYKSNKAFVADVLLVFQNCCVINPAIGPEYRAAENLGRYFLQRVRESGLVFVAEQPSQVKIKIKAQAVAPVVRKSLESDVDVEAEDPYHEDEEDDDDDEEEEEEEDDDDDKEDEDGDGDGDEVDDDYSPREDIVSPDYESDSESSSDDVPSD